MKTPSFLTLVLVAGATLMSRGSTASACETCKLGRGTSDAISNGLLQTGGMGANPAHAGVSLDPDDLRADMSVTASKESAETAFIFGLNAAVQMKTGLNGSRPTPYDPMQIATSERGINMDRSVVPSLENSLPFAPTVQSDGIENAEPSDLVIADPQDAGRAGDSATQAPEPATLSLLCLALFAMRRRRGR